MFAKKTLYGTEAKTKLLEGITELYKSVASTLGPSGKNVLIEKHMGVPHVTKDGVTVAMEQNFLDKFKNIGAQMIKQAAIKTGEEAGDGTTTSIVLANAMIEEGTKLIASGINPIIVKRGMDRLVEEAVAKIRELASPVETFDDIKNVAIISANNDEALGELIARGAERVGKDGHIAVEESSTIHTDIEFVDGMQIQAGMISPYFVTDSAKMEAVLNNPVIVVYDNKISDMQELIMIMETAKREGRPVLVFCEDMQGMALSGTIMNHVKGNIKACVVKTPGFAQAKMDKLKDIAIFTGGVILSKDGEHNWTNTGIEQCGGAARVVVKKDETIIIGGKGGQDEVDERVEALRTQLEAAGNDMEKTGIKSRISSLTSGAAILKLGAATDVEMKELKDRADDAIHATLAAMEEGIVPGGGVCLYKVSGMLDGGNEAHKVISHAMQAPLRSIFVNIGANADAEIVKFDFSDDFWKGYNGRDLSIGDMRGMGIIDPAKVSRIALQNAASVAGMLFITDCVMVQDEDDATNAGRNNAQKY